MFLIYDVHTRKKIKVIADSIPMALNKALTSDPQYNRVLSMEVDKINIEDLAEQGLYIIPIRVGDKLVVFNRKKLTKSYCTPNSDLHAELSSILQDKLGFKSLQTATMKVPQMKNLLKDFIFVPIGDL